MVVARSNHNWSLFRPPLFFYTTPFSFSPGLEIVLLLLSFLLPTSEAAFLVPFESVFRLLLVNCLFSLHLCDSNSLVAFSSRVA